jgi:hypothetical protein
LLAERSPTPRDNVFVALCKPNSVDMTQLDEVMTKFTVAHAHSPSNNSKELLLTFVHLGQAI